jgi:hypothetical protein
LTIPFDPATPVACQARAAGEALARCKGPLSDRQGTERGGEIHDARASFEIRRGERVSTGERMEPPSIGPL